MKRFRLVMAVAALVVGLAVNANAAPLGLVTGSPDLTATFLNFSYNPAGCSGSYDLCLSAPNAAISTVGLSPDITDIVPSSLLVNIDPSGNLIGTGTFLVGGYLSGVVTDFGFQFAGGSSVLEFLVDITGGSLAGAFGPNLGVTAAVFGFGGFAPFETSGVSDDNFAAVPEPMTLSLVGLGLAGLAARRRRQS